MIRKQKKDMPVAYRWVMGLYALFYSALLPFICWGALGDPGHAHTQAHFVFTAVHDTPSPHTHPHPSEAHSHPASSGQATPDTLAVELVTLVGLAAGLLLVQLVYQSRCVRNPLALVSLSLSVPTPPPRPLV